MPWLDGVRQVGVNTVLARNVGLKAELTALEDPFFFCEYLRLSKPLLKLLLLPNYFQMPYWVMG
jgi:hypothetical protein